MLGKPVRHLLGRYKPLSGTVPLIKQPACMVAYLTYSIEKKEIIVARMGVERAVLNTIPISDEFLRVFLELNFIIL
jgi:hypothetical protein